MYITSLTKQYRRGNEASATAVIKRSVIVDAGQEIFEHENMVKDKNHKRNVNNNRPLNDCCCGG